MQPALTANSWWMTFIISAVELVSVVAEDETLTSIFMPLETTAASEVFMLMRLLHKLSSLHNT